MLPATPATQPRRIFDVSIPITPEMVVWPGDPPVQVEKVLDVCCGDLATVRRLTLGSHTGTHVDAFSHFKKTGLPLSQMDLSIYVGPCRVVEVPNSILAITPEVLKAAGVDLETVWPDRTRRLVLKTRNSSQFWGDQPFNTEFVYLTPEAGAHLVACGVQLVAVDYLSVEGYSAENAPTHHCLMDAGVYIVEGLYLEAVPAGTYELICLPLSIADGDGAPARVIIRELPDAKESQP